MTRPKRDLRTEPLCRTCRHYQYSNVGFSKIGAMNQFTRRDRHYCDAYVCFIEKEATFCRDYDDKRNPKLHDLEQMAYIMEKKNVIGFDKPVIEFKKPEPR